MSLQTHAVVMLAIALLTVACSACLCVAAVLYRARVASRSFALTFLACSALAIVMLARMLR